MCVANEIAFTQPRGGHYDLTYSPWAMGGKVVKSGKMCAGGGFTLLLGLKWNYASVHYTSTLLPIK